MAGWENTGSGGGTGTPGATGAPGAAATIAVDSVITGAPGSSAAVVNVGTSSAAALKFTIPRGDTGAAGSAATGGLVYKGVYDSASLYVVNDIVKFNSYMYICKINTVTNNPPINITSQAATMSASPFGTIPATSYNGVKAEVAVNSNLPVIFNFTYVANRYFSSVNLFDDTDYPTYGGSGVAGVTATLDGVAKAVTGAYDATNKLYKIDIPAGSYGKLLSFTLLGSGAQIIISEIEIYEKLAAYPNIDTSHWDVLAYCGSKVDDMWAQKWTEKFILNNPADAYVSPSLPLTRNGTMATMDFYVTGTTASATTITVKQGATTVGSISLSTAGKSTLTFVTAVTGLADDLFTYTVGGAGLAACVVVCNQKWVNR